jgi:uncharacterized repeat protein (TIGR03803 family)
MKRFSILFIFFLIIPFTNIAQYTVVKEFGGSDGQWPKGTLVLDNTLLYGTTSDGGMNDNGTIFKVKPDGSSFTTVFSFDESSGTRPGESLLIIDEYLYGMTETDGANIGGTIYKVKKDGTDFTVLHDLNSTDGRNPRGSLITDGTFLYGMTRRGGDFGTYGLGTIFKIKPDGTGFTKLHDFGGGAGGGIEPEGSLLLEGAYLYGMTSDGGSNGDGAVFRIKPDGTGFQALHAFDYPDGRNPLGSLVSDGSTIYGMTHYGGADNEGIIFKLAHDGTNYSILHEFDGTNGSRPQASLLYDGVYLYGTTWGGGTNDNGVIFEIKTDGTAYSIIHDFEYSTGYNPWGSLIADGDFIFGTTRQSSDLGVVFKLAHQTNDVGIDENSIESLENLVIKNPTKGEIILSFEKPLNGTEYKVYSSMGSLIDQGNLNSSTEVIDISNQENGVYFLHIGDSNKAKSYKIIKI